MTDLQMEEGAQTGQVGAFVDDLQKPNDGVTGPDAQAQNQKDRQPTLPPRQRPASTPYADTDGIKKAAKGREAEVLEALDIPWRAGHPHILCPYPGHDDRNASWRWDEAAGKAFCTCTGDGADSVFDVLMKVEGVDFAQAKLRIAEILRLDDLVKPGIRDAAWYLKPSAKACDDDLPRAYLANRLGLPAADVLMPSTPVAGWESLGYYDGTVEKVGDYSCIVFGPINPAGHVHAYRIYVQPGGAGKAQLPDRADGSKRDVKKAIYLEGAKIVGHSVNWGDASKARQFIVGEGIETMAAVAQAYRAEIERGDIAVAAAMSASWLKNWRPWPGATRVVIAADRDEDKSHDDAGYKAGEKAAKKLAAGLAASGIQVAIAMPGKKKSKTDWLDIHCSGGADAVGAGIADAVDVEVEAVEAKAAEPATAAVETPHLAPLKAKGENPSQRDQLMIAARHAKFWRSTEGDAAVTIQINGHAEHYKVRSSGFRNWLVNAAGREFPVEIAGIWQPNGYSKTAIEEALTYCEAFTSSCGIEHEERLRLASIKDADANVLAIYIDLGTSDWRAVEIDSKGWRIVAGAPIPILRTKRTRPLPNPVHGGAIEPLRKFLPIAADDNDSWRLAVLWLLAALWPVGPYPILSTSGEGGAGKSFMARMLRRLVDPSGGNGGGPPQNEADLVSVARNNHVLAFDNISSLNADLADSLCRLATGGDIGGRALYTNDETAAFSAMRPIILNGIPELATRGDLASRAVFVRLDPIMKRKTEKDLNAEFEKAAGGIFGALLDALSGAIGRLPQTKLPEDSAVFRMADFAVLAQAVEKSLGWKPGEALEAYRRNIIGGAKSLVEADAVAIALQDLIRGRNPPSYNGKLGYLYILLCNFVDENTKRLPEWPKSVNGFSAKLTRIAGAMRASGIDIQKSHTTDGSQIAIKLIDDLAAAA